MISPRRLQQCSLSPPRPAALSSYVRTQTHVCPSPIANSRFGSALFRVQRENSPFFLRAKSFGAGFAVLLFFPIRVVAGSHRPGSRRGVGSSDSWWCRCLSVDLRLKFLHPPASNMHTQRSRQLFGWWGGFRPESDVFV